MKQAIEISKDWDGSTVQKQAYHSACRSWLKKVAKALGLKPGEFEIRSCKGGSAVLGEVVLHSDNLYVCMGGSYCTQQFYYRTCKGRKDYTGGRNNWMNYEDINDFDEVIRRFKNPVQ